MEGDLAGPESNSRTNVIRLKQVPEKMKSAERTTGAER
jgi:hypothetical protein